MTGIAGTGPYAEIRSLRQEIGNLRYTSYLIQNGLARGSVDTCKKEMATRREQIKEIRAGLKKPK